MAKEPASFSIDDFIGEIEKAEAETLEQAAAAGAAEEQARPRQRRPPRRRAAGLGDGKLKPQPLIKKSEGPMPVSAPDAKPGQSPKKTRSAATGMSLKAPKSKANAVERPDFSGLGEKEQAGFGHVPAPAASPPATSRAPPPRTRR
jgi:excinuclease ABC subunit B